MTTLAELTTPLTVNDATAAIYAALAARGVDVAVWKSGSPTRTIVACFAIVVSALSQLQAVLARMGFLALSSGAWLKLVGLYVYGVTYDEGSFASGPVTLTNASGFSYTLAAGELTVSNGATGKTYRNVAGFTLGPSSSLSVDVQATEIGSASSSGATAVDTVVTSLIGVTCSNPAAIVGTDAEDEEAYRTRCSAKTGALSPDGPSDAYRYFATSTPSPSTGASIGVNRVRTIADGTGHVDVYAATPSGSVSGSAGDPTTDLGAIAAAIEQNAVPVCVTATTHSATPLGINATAEVWIDSSTGLSSTAARDAIYAALRAWIDVRPIGGDQIPGETTGRVYASQIEAEIGKANPKTLRVSLSVPAADVDVGASEAPVAGTLTVTVHMVAGGA